MLQVSRFLAQGYLLLNNGKIFWSLILSLVLHPQGDKSILKKPEKDKHQ